LAGAADAASSSFLLLPPSSLSSPSESLLLLLLLLPLVWLSSSLPLDSESELDEVRVRSTIARAGTDAAEAAGTVILVGLCADAPATPFPAAPNDSSSTPADLFIIIRMRRARMPSTSSSFLRTSNTRSSDT
jgi:hypothetical protein